MSDLGCFRFCPLWVIAESQPQGLNRWKTAIRSSEGRGEEAHGVLQDRLSKIEHTARLGAATLGSAASRLPVAPPETARGA